MLEHIHSVYTQNVTQMLRLGIQGMEMACVCIYICVLEGGAGKKHGKNSFSKQHC